MTPPDIDQALEDGIAALKRGQKAEARALLLRVVEADEARVEAWLWLSAAVDDHADQITALENVLALDPDHSAARQGLAQLQAESPTLPPAEEPPGPAFPASATQTERLMSSLAAGAPQEHADARLAGYGHLARIDSVMALDDPYQCIYCGAPAPAELRRCAECGRSLLAVAGRAKLSDTLRSAAIFVMITIALSALAAVLVLIFYSQGDAFGSFVYDHYWFLSFLVGDYRRWSAPLTQVVLVVQFTGVGLLVLSVLGLVYQLSPAFYSAIGLLILNLLWMLFCWREDYLGPLLAATSASASVASLALIFAAQPDFRVNPVRLRCAIDPRIKGGEALNRLGHIAKRQGQWALAVGYWRAAIAAMPNQAAYYKDLAIGYAQIGYYARALKALDEFARQAADPRDFEPMQTLIRQKQAQDSAPRG